MFSSIKPWTFLGVKNWNAGPLTSALVIGVVPTDGALL